TGLRFGEAGLELGLLTRDSMLRAFGQHYMVDFFHLEPKYFPQSTRDLFPVKTMIRLGLLPLGLKRTRGFFRTGRILNIGLLDPSAKQSIHSAEQLAATQVEGLRGVKPYLV